MPEPPRDEITRLEEEYEKDPEGRLFVHLAEAYRKSGELERARDLLNQGLAQHPDAISARVVLAQVHDELGDRDQARQAWEEVVRQDPEHENALRALAGIEYDNGRPREALGYYRRLRDLGAADEEVESRIAQLEPSVGWMQQEEGAAEEQWVQDQAGGDGEQREAEVASEAATAPEAEAERAAEATQQSRKAVATEQGGLPATTDAIGLSDLLVRLLEYRDSTFRADSSLTRLLALAIGRELELEHMHLEALALAALLSDIGGLALTDHAPAIGRPADQAERAAQQREVAISLQLLQQIALPVGVHEAIRHQHERWDGSGYPEGLREDEIPYTARVLAVARACAEKLTGSSNGRGRGVRGALDELQRQAGSRFDPVIVSVLRRVFQRRSEHGIGYGLGGRVLIVHPEELRTLGMATQLHTNGFVSEMAPEAARARARLRESHMEAIVVGAVLPDTDVGRFIREVRNSPGSASLPIVVIDANEMDLRVELLTAGADVCFPSETNFREFKATLDALLRRREETQSVGP